jgi:splicing factor 3B subunit 3
VEKQKFVYVLNRDASQISISSPLPAHSPSTITFSIVALDVGYENPMFASIEVDYSDNVGKLLVYYELDLGLNHVVRKWSTTIDKDAHSLLAVPGGSDGPGGVLVFCLGKIVWCHMGHENVSIQIPNRPLSLTLTEQELPMIVSSVMHRMKGFFFSLLQTEQGDLFKLTLDYPTTQEGIGSVESINIQYYDTVRPSSSLLLLKAGFLFVGAEFGNHELYQIDNLGDEDDTQRTFSSLDTVEAFNPRPLRNLMLTHQLDNLAPLLNSHVQEPTGESHVIYTFSGRSHGSSMRMLQPGITATELAVSELPGAPTRLWTLAAEGEYDSHIIVSFLNATLVLQMDEEGNVDEMAESPLLGTVATLALYRMGQGVVQIHAGGVRHVRNFLGKPRIHEWKTPAGKVVLHAAVNLRQVALALSSGEIVYFEQDQTTGLLNEFADRATLDDITCLALAKVDPDRLRSRFLVVGARDNTVRVLSLEKDRTLQVISMQALSAAPASCSLVTMEREGEAYLVLQTGLENGLLYRTIVDVLQGTLSDTRIRFLGAKPVLTVPVTVAGKEAVFCLSSKPWLSYSHAQSSRLTPVAYDALDHVSSFHTPQCEEGYVGISGNVLKIFTVDNLDQHFTATDLTLSYTPRGIHVDPSGLMVVLESDNRTMTPSERELKQKKRKREQAEEEHVLWGHPRAQDGQWSSLIRVVSPDGKTLQTVDLGDEAALSICSIVFANRQDASFLAVGTVKGMRFAPRRVESGFIRLYRLEAGKLTFQHEVLFIIGELTKH